MTVNHSFIISKRRKGTIMYVIGTIFALFTILSYDEWGIMIFWGLLALGFFSYGFFCKQVSDRVYRYVDLIEAGYTKLEDLSSKMGITEDEVKENINDILNSGMLLGIYYDKDTKEQGKNLIKTLKEKIEGKIPGVEVEFKEVIVDNRGFEKKIQDINNEKYILKNSEIKKEYEIMPNYLKKSQAKRLLENKMKNL